MLEGWAVGRNGIPGWRLLEAGQVVGLHIEDTLDVARLDLQGSSWEDLGEEVGEKTGEATNGRAFRARRIT